MRRATNRCQISAFTRKTESFPVLTVLPQRFAPVAMGDTRRSDPTACLSPFDLAADTNGFSRAAADAVGVGRREALGVRQLAAALSLCANNVSVPISAGEGFFRRLRRPPIGTRDNLQGMPQSWDKAQATSLSLCCDSLPKAPSF